MSKLVKVFINRKVNLNLFRHFYPEVITTIRRYTNSLEDVMDHLWMLGKKIGINMGEMWNKNNTKLETIIKDARKFLSTKKVKIIKHPDKLEIIDEDCALCSSAIEVSDIHYCAIHSGFLEGFLNELSTKLNLPAKEFSGKTVNSRSSGDDFCKHEIYFTKKVRGDS